MGNILFTHSNIISDPSCHHFGQMCGVNNGSNCLPCYHENLLELISSTSGTFGNNLEFFFSAYSEEFCCRSRELLGTFIEESESIKIKQF